jgi:hypothetical protein
LELVNSTWPLPFSRVPVQAVRAVRVGISVSSSSVQRDPGIRCGFCPYQVRRRATKFLAAGVWCAMQVAVLSDTHAPRRWRSCPPRVAALLRDTDLILHAGDVCLPTVLDELAAFAPVRAVRGNNDGPDVAAWGAPEALELDLDGLAVALIHDAGPADGRAARMRVRFPTADLVVFGHSHIPLDHTEGDLRIFNPGSPTDRRHQPQGTVGLLRIEAGRLTTARIVPVT